MGVGWCGVGSVAVASRLAAGSAAAELRWLGGSKAAARVGAAAWGMEGELLGEFEGGGGGTAHADDV